MKAQKKLPFRGEASEAIAVEHYAQPIQDSRPLTVEEHCHDFYELVFVKNGMAEHAYQGTSVTLMAGDVLLVLPGQVHRYIFSESIEIYNLQFFEQALQPEFKELVQKLSLPELRASSLTVRAGSGAADLKFAPLNLQGIIHMNYSESLAIESILQKILAELSEKLDKYEILVRSSLLELMIMLERIMTSQFRQDVAMPRKHQDIVDHVLSYIDAHYDEELDFDTIASAQELSPGYFRKIFKSSTGTSPIDHLNRIRVLKALELLRDYDCNVGDVAAQVGIFDANYFSRMFKKYLGYPPSHFQKVSGSS